MTATQTFQYIGPEAQFWTVPEGVTKISAKVVGAPGQFVNPDYRLGFAGWSTPGLGVIATTRGFSLDVVPGERLEIRVGGTGTNGQGGYNGGGSGGIWTQTGVLPTKRAGGGGGASEIRRSTLNSDGVLTTVPLLVAGGGGGAGVIYYLISRSNANGGHAGGGGDGTDLNGMDGEPVNTNVGFRGLNGLGGSQSAGGAGGRVQRDSESARGYDGTPGILGQGGDGGYVNKYIGYEPGAAGGGGGGGYYGGGGGASGFSSGLDIGSGGGGGGSSFAVHPASVTFTRASINDPDNGYVILQWSTTSQCVLTLRNRADTLLQSFSNVDVFGRAVESSVDLDRAIRALLDLISRFANVHYSSTPCCVGVMLPGIECALPFLGTLANALPALPTTQWPGVLRSVADLLQSFQTCFVRVCDVDPPESCSTECDANQFRPQWTAAMIRVLAGVLQIPLYDQWSDSLLVSPVKALYAVALRIQQSSCASVNLAFDGTSLPSLNNLASTLDSFRDPRATFVHMLADNAYPTFAMCSQLAPTQISFLDAGEYSAIQLRETGLTYIRSNVRLTGRHPLTGRIRFTLTDTGTGETIADDAGRFFNSSGAPADPYVTVISGAQTYASPLALVTTATLPDKPWAWTARYEGDDVNAASTTFLGDPLQYSVVFKATPRLRCTDYPSDATLTLSAPNKLLAITCVMVGGRAPTGSLVFELYGPRQDATATVLLPDQLLQMTTRELPLPSSSSSSAPYLATRPGRYYWKVTYSGDRENDTVVNLSSEQQLDEGYTIDPVRGDVVIGPLATVTSGSSSGSSKSLAQSAFVSEGFRDIASTATFRFSTKKHQAARPLLSLRTPSLSLGQEALLRQNDSSHREVASIPSNGLTWAMQIMCLSRH